MIIKRGVPMGGVVFCLALIFQVIGLGSSQAAALPLDNLLSPVNKIINSATDKVLPDTVKTATKPLEPVTKRILPETLDATDKLTGGYVVQPTTKLVHDIVTPVTNEILPETVNDVNDIVSPVTGDTVPQVLNTVNDAATPTTNALAPVVDNSLGTTPATQPVARTVTPLLRRGVLSPITPTRPTTPGGQDSPVTPITTPVMSFANPAFTQPSKGTPPLSLVSAISGFIGFFPETIGSLFHNLTHKKLDSTSLLVATAILGIMLAVFVAAGLRMITRGRHGLHAIGQDFLLETPLYFRMAKISAVAFGTLGVGSVALYIVLVQL